MNRPNACAHPNIPPTCTYPPDLELLISKHKISLAPSAASSSILSAASDRLTILLTATHSSFSLDDDDGRSSSAFMVLLAPLLPSLSTSAPLEGESMIDLGSLSGSSSGRLRPPLRELMELSRTETLGARLPGVMSFARGSRRRGTL